MVLNELADVMRGQKWCRIICSNRRVFALRTHRSKIVALTLMFEFYIFTLECFCTNDFVHCDNDDEDDEDNEYYKDDDGRWLNNFHTHFREYI